MLLVPEALIESFTRKDQQKSTAELDEVVRLDAEIEKLLVDKTLPLEQKVARYNDIIQQYLHFRDEIRNSAPSVDHVVVPRAAVSSASSSPPPDSSIERIVSTIPKTYQKKARAVLDQLSSSNAASWSKGNLQLIYNGEPIEGSNIQDLVYASLVPNKQPAPTGFEKFQKALAEANVSGRLLRRQIRAVEQPTTSAVPEKITKVTSSKKAIQSEDETDEFQDAAGRWITTA